MYGKINALEARACVKLKGVMCEGFLNLCASNALPVLRASKINEYEMKLIIPARRYAEAEFLARKCGCETELISTSGSRAWGKVLKRRIFPSVLALCFVGLLFWSKFFVWEIKVYGNEYVSAGEILNALASCGVKSGAFWPDFSADNIRSEVLSTLPSLSWITVNMHGSLAEVKVVERKMAPEMVFEGDCADIVAESPGFVRSVNALVGQALVRSGAAVREGDVLVSGALESPFAPPRFVRAYGSVTAEINSELTAVVPENEAKKLYKGGESHRYAIIIGNNRINFYSGSSISDAFCDKIISVWKFEAGGLFSMPVSLVRETERYFETESLPRDSREVSASIESSLRSAFSVMFDLEEVLGEKLSFATSGGLHSGTLRTRCLCEIGALSPISDERKNEIKIKYTEKVNDDIWQNAE